MSVSTVPIPNLQLSQLGLLKVLIIVALSIIKFAHSWHYWYNIMQISHTVFGGLLQSISANNKRDVRYNGVNVAVRFLRVSLICF